MLQISQLLRLYTIRDRTMNRSIIIIRVAIMMSDNRSATLSIINPARTDLGLDQTPVVTAIRAGGLCHFNRSSAFHQP